MGRKKNMKFNEYMQEDISKKMIRPFQQLLGRSEYEHHSHQNGIIY